jgi:hypothetical protein
VVCDSRLHRGRHSQRLVDAAEVIVHVVDCDRGDMILNFLRVGVRQVSESAHVHPRGQILLLDIAGRNVLRIRSSSQSARIFSCVMTCGTFATKIKSFGVLECQDCTVVSAGMR